MLTLNIASAEAAPGTQHSPGTMEFTSRALNGRMVSKFPPSGFSSTYSFKLISTESFDLDCLVKIGGDNLRFRFTHLLVGDTLNVSRHDQSSFSATVFHNASHPPNATCTAECADGTKAQGCVVCQSGSIRGKICC